MKPNYRWILASLLLVGVGCGVNDPSKDRDGTNSANSVNSVKAANATNATNAVNGTNSVNAANNTNSVVGADAGVDMFVSGTPFRVATYNVQRFFDTVCDTGDCSSGSFEEQKSDAEFNFRASQIAGAIEDIDPDVIMLQELETEECLDALADKLPAYDVAVFGEVGYAASLDVAVLAKGSLLEVRKHRDVAIYRPDGSRTSFAREFLEVHFEREGQRYVAFSAHFKARRNDDPGRRIAEAIAAREIMSATVREFPDAVVVLGGDLNDEPGSTTIDELSDSSDLDLLTDDVPDLWSYSYLGEEVVIDHLVMGTGGKSAAPFLPEAIHGGSGGLGGSDHAAVIVDLRVVE